MAGKIISGILVILVIIGIATGNIGFLNTNAESIKGSVYYLNFKPEQDGAWQELARIYTGKTGVPVTVVTAASGQYRTTLAAELSKLDAPTLFQVQDPASLNGREDFCIDLSESDIFKELTSDAYTLKSSDNKLCAIAYTVESYGLIANLKLLEKAGYSRNDINSFDDLKRISEDITKRNNELGFAAFCSTGMDKSSNWRFVTHLTNLPIYYEYKDKNISISDKIDGKYIKNYKNIFDLYINNGTCSSKDISAKTCDDARNEFLSGKAVFFQNGSWECANLIDSKAFNSDEIVMLPIYIGAPEEQNQGLCTGTENYWCVNSRASKADIKATLDFIYWCVTSDEGTKFMADRMGFVIPFKNAVKSDNIFVQQANQYVADGKIPVSWSFCTIPSEEWKNNLTSALVRYGDNQTEENWKFVEAAFVDKWEAEYKLINGR